MALTTPREFKKIVHSGGKFQQHEQQFLKAYVEYSRPVFKYCYYRFPDDKDKAHDIVQETYCRIWKYIIAGKKIVNMRALIYKVARNIVIDEGRKKKSFSLDRIMEKGFSIISRPAEMSNDYFAAREILQVIKTLDKKYQDAILLKYVYDFSNYEISLLLQETANNIYVRIHRGFKQVRKVLESQGANTSVAS